MHQHSVTLGGHRVYIYDLATVFPFLSTLTKCSHTALGGLPTLNVMHAGMLLKSKVQYKKVSSPLNIKA